MQRMGIRLGVDECLDGRVGGVERLVCLGDRRLYLSGLVAQGIPLALGILVLFCNGGALERLSAQRLAALPVVLGHVLGYRSAQALGRQGLSAGWTLIIEANFRQRHLCNALYLVGDLR